MLQLHNPIPEAIRDQKQLADLMGEYNIVPYYGCDDYTSHSFLGLISDVTELSPSHTACKRDFRTYAFGNSAKIVAQQIAGFYDEDFDEAIPRTEQIAFLEWLKDLGITLPATIDCVNQLNSSLLDSGNAYMLIRIVKVGSTHQVYMFPLHYTQCAYLATKAGEVKKIINTEVWSEEWWKTKKPLLVSASHPGKPFNWDVKRNGAVKETILHISSGKGKSKYYGRPDILPVLYWMFVEFQMANMSVKTSMSEYTAKKVLAFEEPDPTRRKGTTNSGFTFRKKMDALRKLTTNEGNFDESKTIAAVQYPHGGKPPTAITLEVNRDTAYAEYQWDKASGLIHAVNGWDRTLTNIVTPKAAIGGNIYKDLFQIKGVSTIKPMQTFWQNVLSDIFDSIAEETGYIGEVRTLKFNSALDNLIADLGNENKNTENGAATGNANLRSAFEAYGIGVRSGAITPQREDEEHFRAVSGLPAGGEDVNKAWSEDEGIRRPTTLKSKGQVIIDDDGKT